MSQGYSSGGNQGNNNAPLNSSVYNFNNMQGSIANFLVKEIKSYMDGYTYNAADRTTTRENAPREDKLENVIAALNNVAENIKSNYKQVNSIGDNESTPALEKLSAELNNIINSTAATYSNNLDQLKNQATLSITEYMSRNPDTATDLLTIEGANGNAIDDKGSNELLKLNNSSIAQLVNHAQVQTGILTHMDRTLTGIATTAGIKIPTLLMDLDAQNDKAADAKQAEEEDWFAGLGATLSKTIFNHPGVNKLSQALGQLGNLALIKGIITNQDMAKNHPTLHKAAALAVYFQLPQLAVNLMGAVFQQAVSNWLVKSIGPQLGKGLTNSFKDFPNIFKNGIKAPLSNIGKIGQGIKGLGGSKMGNLIRWGGGLSIGLGAIQGIAGAIGHHNKMKTIEDQIDNNSNLSAEQKRIAKLKAGKESGEKVGKEAGASVGSGIGMIVGGALGGPLGAIIGSFIGKIIGQVLGGWLGKIFGGWKHYDWGAGFNKIWKSITSGFVNLIKFIVKAIDVTLSILSFFMPIFKPIRDGFRLIIEWIKNRFKDGNKNNPKNNIGSNLVTSKVINDTSHPVEASEAAKISKQNGNFETVSMRNIGLFGKIDKSNSVPYIAKKNTKALRQLDGILKGWGYDVKYTSAMGGGDVHQKGPRSHAAGNKVDFVVSKGGKIVHLSNDELKFLKSIGYIGHGAIGDEGDHTDASINSSNVKITEPYVKAFEEEKKKAKEKAEEEKRKKEKKDIMRNNEKDNVAYSNLLPLTNLYNTTANGGQSDISMSKESIMTLSMTDAALKVGGTLL